MHGKPRAVCLSFYFDFPLTLNARGVVIKVSKGKVKGKFLIKGKIILLSYLFACKNKLLNCRPK